MAANGNRGRGRELKKPCRSDTYVSSENHQLPAASTAACHDEPEAKRQRRVAKYKAYAVESKFKASLRNGIRWVKIKCSELLNR
ncbi:hypothetical protein SDJN02_23834, partial [Cucurbita argyrosperma subsp. argyrosperma]